MKFDEKLQKLRKERGMSQENLAQLLNVSRQSVSKWESGVSLPETDKIITISELFSVSLDELLRDGEIKTTKEIEENVQYWNKVLREYEYKSKTYLFGLPLVHVNVGNKKNKAKGIIAIGNYASGLISLGIFSCGIISLGVFSAGIVSLGSFSFGLLLSLGAISIGYFSFGAIAIGIYAIGAVAIGSFTMGALSVASHIAVGKSAYGDIAIGENVNGNHLMNVDNISNVFNEVKRADILKIVETSYTGFFKSLSYFVAGFFK